MSRNWERVKVENLDVWAELTPDRQPICVFYRDPAHNNAWVIQGTGVNGAHFMIVSTSELIEDIKREAELILYDFGWVPRDG